MKINIIEGHVLDRLRELPDESVHCCVTSPPYWGLRDYSTEPQIWGGDSKCKHKWSIVPIGGRNKPPQDDDPKFAKGMSNPRGESNFCSKCNAWRGHLGLEPTIIMFVEHVVEICREVWRALRKDGTFWMVLGDSYAGGGRAGKNPKYMKKHTNFGKTTKNVGKYGLPTPIPEGLKAKNLVGQPWRIAFALQADGWYLRKDIIWHKPNSMPESCKDRPTSAHEDVFLLTKSAKYYYDQEVVREPHTGLKDLQRRHEFCNKGTHGGIRADLGRDRREYFHPNGRNLRDVWTIPTQSFPGAHFATFPEKLVKICIKAGASQYGCCPKCSAPWKRIIEYKANYIKREIAHAPHSEPTKVDSTGWEPPTIKKFGWCPTCDCYLPGQSDWPKLPKIKDAKHPTKVEEKKIAACWRKRLKLIEQYKEHPVVPCTVLDPFVGSGTSGVVAAKLGRDFIGIDLNHHYVKMAKKRIRMAVTGLSTREVMQDQKVMFEEKGLFK